MLAQELLGAALADSCRLCQRACCHRYALRLERAAGGTQGGLLLWSDAEAVLHRRVINGRFAVALHQGGPALHERPQSHERLPFEALCLRAADAQQAHDLGGGMAALVVVREAVAQGQHGLGAWGEIGEPRLHLGALRGVALFEPLW